MGGKESEAFLEMELESWSGEVNLCRNLRRGVPTQAKQTYLAYGSPSQNVNLNMSQHNIIKAIDMH